MNFFECATVMIELAAQSLTPNRLLKTEKRQ